MSDILELPPPLRELINWVIRKRDVGLADLAARLGQDEASVRCTVADLVNRGYLRETRLPEETRYRVRFAPQRRQKSTLLDI